MNNKIFGRWASWVLTLSALAALLTASELPSVRASDTFIEAKSENKTLVLVDSWATLETHSIFFDHVRQMGAANHTLEFKLISGSASDKVGIQQFNKYFYDNIIFMAPTVKSLGSDLQIKEILEFVDFHHNIMIFASSETRKQLRQLVNEFGVDFEDYGYSMRGGKAPENSVQAGFDFAHVAWSKNMFKPLYEDKQIFTTLKRPVLFPEGVGSVLDTPENNPHVFPILKADSSSYSFNPEAPNRAETGLVSGEQLTLVAGY